MPDTTGQLLPNIAQGAAIGILGGSFNPPHMGHQLLALSFLSLDPIDQLWIIPCADHVFHKQLSPFDHRFNMCRLAFSHLGEQAEVLSLENALPKPNKTVHTLETLAHLRPDLKLFMAIGSDVAAQFEKWHRPEDIIQLCTIVIFERQGFQNCTRPAVLRNAIIHADLALPDIQGRTLRHIFQNKAALDSCSLLDRAVKQYIKTNNLYVP